MPVVGANVYAATANFGDNAPPSVSLTAPGSGFVRGAVTVAAGASDNFGVARVDLSLAGATKAATGAPFAATFDSAQLPDGPTSATARATDVNGHASTVASAPVTIDNTAPTVEVSGPSNRTFAPGSTQAGSSRPPTPPPASRRCSAAWWPPARRPRSARARAARRSRSPTTSHPARYRFTARVTDNAGNVFDATRDFTVAASLQAAVAANGGTLPGSDGSEGARACCRSR